MSGPDSPREPGAGQASQPLRYALLALGVAILAAAGYVGYHLYPRFGLPAVQGAGLLLLAAGAGIASFFSPCAFPLLLTLLARETGRGVPGAAAAAGAAPAAAGAPFARALGFATALSLGATGFLLLTGLVIAWGGAALFAGITFTSTAGIVLRAVVGTLLILLGLIQLDRLPNPLHAVERVARPILHLQAEQRRRRPIIGFAVFGFGYLLAGFG